MIGNMKAVTFHKYGPPEVLKMNEVPRPDVNDHQVLVKVKATSVTAGDWRMRKADPFLARLVNGLLRPHRINVLGFEISGIVESVGKKVDGFRPGDEVYGSCGHKFGGYAEYKCIPANGNSKNGILSQKPENLSFEEAATIPIGAMSALNILKKVNIQPGQTIMIYGASGSVGTYAVQIAKYYGANVTAVCSSANVEMVKSIGADKVLDYTTEDIFKLSDTFDVVFDAVGEMMSGLAKRHFKGLLKPKGRFIHIQQSIGHYPEDLTFLCELVESDHIKPVIDRIYKLDQIVEAHQYVEQKHKKGNVAISVS